MNRFKLVLKAPFNSLSFGQVSYNLAKSLFKLRDKIDLSIFPINGNVDFGAYSLNPEFVKWFKQCADNRYSGIGPDTPCIHLWHIRDSDAKITNNNLLFTFHELDSLTETESAICGLHRKIAVSSEFSKSVFKKSGVINCATVCIGFDDEVGVSTEDRFPDAIHFGLVGKWENRKNTAKIIKTWASIFGNKSGYRLTCLVENSFLSPEQNQSCIKAALGDTRFFNISFLPRLSTNALVNDFYHSIDIDLSGLSSAEGWNLPAFNATCSGKWSIVSNCTAHKDWATPENSILVEPSGLVEPYDGVFFQKGGKFNQGMIYEISEQSMSDAMMKSLTKAKKPNLVGIKTGEEFTYDKTLQQLLELL